MKHEEHLDKILKEKLEGLNFEFNPAHWEMMQDRMNIEGMDTNPDAFDAAMKGKLENISPDFNPLHWEMMQDAMAAEGLTSEVDPIDELIKSRLENITPELNPVHWEMMKDAMDADGMEVALDPVDEILKSKLENIEYAFQPSHWDALKERIDEEAFADAKQVEDVLFDASTYSHLSNVEIPYNEEHWELMKERIDAEFSIRGKLMRYKVAEVALILMIIITSFHYLPIHKKKMRNKAIAKTTVIDQNKSTEQTTSEIASIANSLNNSNNSNTATSISQKEVVTNSATQNIENAIASNEVVTNNTSTPIFNEVTNNVTNSVGNNVTDLTQQDIVVGPPTNFTNTPIAKTAQPMSEDFASAIAQSIIANAESDSKTGSVYESNVIKAMTEVAVVETLQASLLDIENGDETVGCETCTGLEQKWGLSFGMFSAFDLNHVMTPYDNVFQEGSYQQNAFGYGGGFSLGFRYNRWEVETGAIYSYKQYAPKPRIEIFSGNLTSGYLGESINNVELNMINIPLNLKYHFLNKGKWNLYGLGGANLNMAMQANYDKKHYFFSGNGAIGGSVPVGSQIAVSETTAKKRFADGILEGGSFLENRYFTANLGFGVERKFTPRWSIFGQPTYQHQLISQGLGPNNDRINSLSILTGARVTF